MPAEADPAIGRTRPDCRHVCPRSGEVEQRRSAHVRRYEVEADLRSIDGKDDSSSRGMEQGLRRAKCRQPRGGAARIGGRDKQFEIARKCRETPCATHYFDALHLWACLADDSEEIVEDVPRAPEWHWRLCRAQLRQCSSCRFIYGWHELGVSLDGYLEIGERDDPGRGQARSRRDIDQLLFDQQTDVPRNFPQCVGNGTLVAHGLHFRERVADDLQSVGMVGSLPVRPAPKVRGLGQTAADGGDVGEKAEGGLGPRHQSEADQRVAAGPGLFRRSDSLHCGSGGSGGSRGSDVQAVQTFVLRARGIEGGRGIPCAT
jgi:hypothetical protein